MDCCNYNISIYIFIILPVFLSCGDFEHDTDEPKIVISDSYRQLAMFCDMIRHRAPQHPLVVVREIRQVTEHIDQVQDHTVVILRVPDDIDRW